MSLYYRQECTGATEWDCLHCRHHKVYNNSRPTATIYYNISTSPLIPTSVLLPTNDTSHVYEQPTKESHTKSVSIYLHTFTRDAICVC